MSGKLFLECMKISLPIALQFAEEFQRSYPDKRPIHELMAELNEAIRDALISARRELEEKKDAILQSAAKIIEQSKEIERLQRVEFELRRQLESRLESEPPVKQDGWSLDKNVMDFMGVAENLRAEGQESRARAVEYLIQRVLLEDAARVARPESELKVQEIIALIEKLDDFCIEQFKKRLTMYVDEARSLPDCPQQEREDWTSSILYNIKTDLENYLKQIFPVTDSRPESEHTGVADMERFQRSLEASRISDEEIQMAATKATVTEDGYINLHGARMFELGAKWLRERLGK